MTCSKSGKVVILLQGRFAGRKAVVVQTFDDGSDDRKFGHALVVGIDRHPRRVTRDMGKKKVERRQRVKPFAKFVNFNHMMPTRYTVAVADAIAKDVSKEAMDDAKTKEAALLKVKGALEARYKKLDAKVATPDKDAVGALYFFRKLRF